MRYARWRVAHHSGIGLLNDEEGSPDVDSQRCAEAASTRIRIRYRASTRGLTDFRKIIRSLNLQEAVD